MGTESFRTCVVARLCATGACLAAMLAVAPIGTAQEPGGAREVPETAIAAIPAPSGAAEGDVIVAYYCHVTFRCETCLTTERLIADLLQTDFAAKLEQKSLVWHPLDYEQPENATYAEVFGLEGGPALVLGRWRAGRLVEWHNVVEIWDRADDPIGLVDLTRDRLALFMQPEKWRAEVDSIRVAKAERAAPAAAEPEAPGGSEPRPDANPSAGDTQKGR